MKVISGANITGFSSDRHISLSAVVLNGRDQQGKLWLLYFCTY